MSNRPVLTTATSALFMLFAKIIPTDFVAVVLLVTKEMVDNVWQKVTFLKIRYICSNYS